MVIPVIPGYDDSNENIFQTINFLKKLPKDIEVCLLPYHKYGVDKYEKLGLDYNLENVEKANVEKIKKKIEKENLSAKIGRG